MGGEIERGKVYNFGMKLVDLESLSYRQVYVEVTRANTKVMEDLVKLGQRRASLDTELDARMDRIALDDEVGYDGNEIEYERMQDLLNMQVRRRLDSVLSLFILSERRSSPYKRRLSYSVVKEDMSLQWQHRWL